MGDQRGSRLDVWTLVGIGSYNVVCLLGGFGLGWLADNRMHTAPALTLLGLAAGIAVGVGTTWLRIRGFLRE